MPQLQSVPKFQYIRGAKTSSVDQEISNQLSFSATRVISIKCEEQILHWNLERYHSQSDPKERKKLLQELLPMLKRFSSHWTQRDIRLWFNNRIHLIAGMSGIDAIIETEVRNA